jgi:hypothetical protein
MLKAPAVTGNSILKTPVPGAVLRFAVLIPHRDSLKPLGILSRRLFAAGFPGAFSFPQVAPLALLFRPLSPGELGDLAAALRESSADRGGTITAGPAVSVSMPPASLPLTVPPRNEGPDPPGFSLWGPRLDLAVPAVIPGAIYRFPVPVLCAALIRNGIYAAGTDADGTETAGMEAAAEGLFPLCFTAAAAANMSFTALESGEPGYSFAWKIGEPRWLPRPGKRRPSKETPG